MRHSDVISFNEQEMEGEKKQNKNQKITAKGSWGITIKGAITLCWFAVITPFNLTNYAFNISSAIASATLIPSMPADKIPPA